MTDMSDLESGCRWRVLLRVWKISAVLSQPGNSIDSLSYLKSRCRSQFFLAPNLSGRINWRAKRELSRTEFKQYRGFGLWRVLKKYELAGGNYLAGAFSTFSCLFFSSPFSLFFLYFSPSPSAFFTPWPTVLDVLVYFLFLLFSSSSASIIQLRFYWVRPSCNHG